MSDFFADAFNQLCLSRYGLPVNSIHLVQNEDIGLDAGGLLDKYKVLYDEIYQIKCDGESAAMTGYANSIRLGGLTIFIIVAGLYQAVVFINKNPFSLPDEPENREFLSMCNYMYLIHELGHVDDFFNGNNFSRVDGVVDLVRAEAYADIFTLKKLKSKDYAVNKIALSWYAKGVLANAESSEFYKLVLGLIKKKILEAHIRKWASGR